jgi:hypothetical protein
MSMEMLWSQPLYRTITDIYGIRRQDWPTTWRIVTHLHTHLEKDGKIAPPLTFWTLQLWTVLFINISHLPWSGTQYKRRESGYTTQHPMGKTNWPDLTWHDTLNTGHQNEYEFGVVSSMKEKEMRTKLKYFKCNAGLSVGPCYRMHHGNWIFEDCPALCWWKPNVKCNFYIITILAESPECYWREIWQKPPILVSPYVWNIIIGLIIRYISQSTIRQKYP